MANSLVSTALVKALYGQGHPYSQTGSGTVASIERAPITLDKSKDFKQFDSLLSTPAKVSGMCLGCVRYEVSATLIGRLDGIEPAIQRDSAGKITSISGFGNLNAYGARLVIQSVANVTPQEIDYAKGGVEAGTTATSVAQEFGSSDLQGAAKRGIDAFGKEGDDNGVSVGFGGGNEYAAKSEGKNGASSPDGVIYDCRFDMDRLKGTSLGVAMAHIGQHIADLRNPDAAIKTAGLYQLEFRGSITGMLSAISQGQKSVTAPGGYLLWNSGWSNESFNTNTAAALTGFLAKEAMLSK